MAKNFLFNKEQFDWTDLKMALDEDEMNNERENRNDSRQEHVRVN